MRENCLGSMAVKNNNLSGSAIPESPYNCRNIPHEIFTGLDIQRSIFFAGLVKFKNAADPFKIGVNVDFNLGICNRGDQKKHYAKCYIKSHEIPLEYQYLCVHFYWLFGFVFFRLRSFISKLLKNCISYLQT